MDIFQLTPIIRHGDEAGKIVTLRKILDVIIDAPDCNDSILDSLLIQLVSELSIQSSDEKLIALSSGLLNIISTLSLDQRNLSSLRNIISPLMTMIESNNQLLSDQSAKSLEHIIQLSLMSIDHETELIRSQQLNKNQLYNKLLSSQKDGKLQQNSLHTNHSNRFQQLRFIPMDMLNAIVQSGFLTDLIYLMPITIDFNYQAQIQDEFLQKELESQSLHSQNPSQIIVSIHTKSNLLYILQQMLMLIDFIQDEEDLSKTNKTKINEDQNQLNFQNLIDNQIQKDSESKQSQSSITAKQTSSNSNSKNSIQKGQFQKKKHTFISDILMEEVAQTLIDLSSDINQKYNIQSKTPQNIISRKSSISYLKHTPTSPLKQKFNQSLTNNYQTSENQTLNLQTIISPLQYNNKQEQQQQHPDSDNALSPRNSNKITNDRIIGSNQEQQVNQDQSKEEILLFKKLLIVIRMMKKQGWGISGWNNQNTPQFTNPEKERKWLYEEKERLENIRQQMEDDLSRQKEQNQKKEEDREYEKIQEKKKIQELENEREEERIIEQKRQQEREIEQMKLKELEKQLKQNKQKEVKSESNSDEGLILQDQSLITQLREEINNKDQEIEYQQQALNIERENHEQDLRREKDNEKEREKERKREKEKEKELEKEISLEKEKRQEMQQERIKEKESEATKQEIVKLEKQRLKELEKEKLRDKELIKSLKDQLKDIKKRDHKPRSNSTGTIGNLRRTGKSSKPGIAIHRNNKKIHKESSWEMLNIQTAKEYDIWMNAQDWTGDF